MGGGALEGTRKCGVVGGKEQAATTMSAMQGRKNEICRKVISLGMWHVDFACACALFIIFFFFPIPELSVNSVDRPVPKNDDEMFFQRLPQERTKLIG
jgi:hypothetical protein